jgi:ribonucleotide monophosphatase NagD (HAD superfamily)
MFDCDGVIWNGNKEVTDSFKALKYIQSFAQKKIFLITNNSSRLRETIKDHEIKKYCQDFELPIENIYTSAYATAPYLIHSGLIKDLQT